MLLSDITTLLKPLRLAFERTERGKSDSDVTYFYDLLLAGELILKLTTASLIAGLQDEREKHRYRLIHTLIRSDGIGEWARAIDDCLTGVASTHLRQSAKEERRILTERVSTEAWQDRAVSLLYQALSKISEKKDSLPAKLALRSWFEYFPELRNKTRGHGAITPSTCSETAPLLAESLMLVASNIPAFARPWAYLHRNLSGKYRVLPLSGDTQAFDELKRRSPLSEQHFPDGIYIFIDGPCQVDLLKSNSDIEDFYFPNGAFNGRKFELHSLLTDNRLEGDAQPYLAPALDRPGSETDGARALDIIGNVFTNMPPAPSNYVSREILEKEITDSLTNDRHPIITLVGRGGIGKTSAALTVLHQIAQTNRFDAIIWLSSRDIDLSDSGPKVVQPQVMTEGDMAKEFFSLLQPREDEFSGMTKQQFLGANLRKSSFRGPILFVFDNFETVQSPVDLFNWIDMNVRLPNKVLITSRFREFKADFPIFVRGMERDECDILVNRTAKTLGILNLLTTSYLEQIFLETEGHPYIAKITLGEAARERALGKPTRILARKDDLLDALFERSYAGLSPLAKRIFLTLSAWKSLVPQIALEAVILRNEEEVIDPSENIKELEQMSMVEVTTSNENSDFLHTPLTAALFGQKKLNVSPNRILIENDLKILQEMGPTNAASLQVGLEPRLSNLFRRIARRIADGTTTLDSERPMLEFIARGFPQAWLWIASLHEEFADAASPDAASEAIRRYLESQPSGEDAPAAWLKLANLYRAKGAVQAAAHAYGAAFSLSEFSLSEISNAANWLNNQQQEIASMDQLDRSAIFGTLISIMVSRIKEASATDLSRLAWLYLHAGDERSARQMALLGLDKEPENIHCNRLYERIGRSF